MTTILLVLMLAAPCESRVLHNEPPFPIKILNYFKIKSAWAAPPCSKAETGHPTSDYRASRTKVAFFKEHPCPGGQDKGSTHRCRGYVIDHVCPLECCGKDEPSNMQWQTIDEGKAKDKWESTCSRSCH